MKRTLIVFLTIVFISLSINNILGQNIVFSKSEPDVVGEPGLMLTGYVTFYNSDSDTIEIKADRCYKNLPPNWLSCFCFIQCYPYAVDEVNYFLAPGEKVTLGLGFTTDTIPGTGYIKVTLEQVGGTQKDTLYFSASTIASGINEFGGSKSFRFYPNPASDKVIFNTTASETYSIQLIEITGKVIKQQTEINTKQNIVNIEDIPTGEYFLNARYKSGKTEIQKLIKN